VLKYQHRVAGLVGRYIADPAEREDVTQEAFLRAYRGLERFRCESAFYTWLYRVAVNTACNYRVSAGRHRASQGARTMETEELEGSGWLHDIETPESHAAMHEVREAIDRALASMPECLREAISLREMHGLTYEEIAATMDCPIGTVRSRIARARTVIDEHVHPILERPGPVGAR
jgi:RNA polymerase sigma-70 factor (ECF subfamily)